MNDQNTGCEGAALIYRIGLEAQDSADLVATGSGSTCESFVGHNSSLIQGPYIPEPILETRRVKAPARLRRREKRNLTRHYRYHAEWRRSNYPLPNRFLTIRFDRQRLRDWKLKGKTVAAHLGDTLLPLLREFMTEIDHPWLAQWVIEAKSCPHVHILFYMPEGVELETQLCRRLADHYHMVIPHEAHPITYLDRKNSGEPVCLRQVTPSRSWRGTLRHGVEGALDYMAKSICENATRQKRRTAWNLGKIVGRSSDIRTPLRTRCAADPAANNLNGGAPT